ncbi:hypothetical protein VTJ04DRAFT_10905 [Mycothermus thermophilus]|uniref:uncharacterized protein n=1 Tax=Humicola insolens TaxID=85995 RepID=UPI00374470BB
MDHRSGSRGTPDPQDTGSESSERTPLTPSNLGQQNDLADPPNCPGTRPNPTSPSIVLRDQTESGYPKACRSSNPLLPCPKPSRLREIKETEETSSKKNPNPVPPSWSSSSSSSCRACEVIMISKKEEERWS